MAIKYNTRTGSSFFNSKARDRRDIILKPTLKGMRCTNCGGDSEFTFAQSTDYPGSSSITSTFHACCQEFEEKVYAKLRNS